MASLWFGDKEKGIATAAGSMSLPFGCLLSLLLPNAFINDFTTPEDIISKFHLYLLVSTIIITLFALPALIFLRESPPSPPSVLQNE